MSGERLHDFDIELCTYALGNVRGYLEQPAFASFVEKAIEAPILAYIRSLAEDTTPPLLLTEQDLTDLVELFANNPRLDLNWVPYKPLHRRSINCVADIRGNLAAEYAEEWASQSAGFARRLEDDDPWLHDGIGIVLEWVRLVRRYLRAMGATPFLPYPEGSFPTPACPDPPVPPAPPEDKPPQTGQVEGDAVLGAIAEVRDLLLTQKTVKESYSTGEVAEILGKSEYTVREWCRLGRINASKRQYTRGAYPEWMISHEELTRIKNEGILPDPKKP
jgi:Helix-turn-helix domain